MRPFLLALFCLLPAVPLPTLADPAPIPPPRPSSLRPDILYTHRGEFVQVSPMRALTLNAHVTQFVYDPLGLEIAYVGSASEGGSTTYFAKTVDARTGHEISRLAYSQQGQVLGGFLLLGFSTSGKYLLLEKYTTDSSTGEPVPEFLRWDLSASPPTTKTINLQEALPVEQQRADLEGSADCYPSLTGRWLMFTQSIHTQKDDGKPGADKNAYLLYDPERDTFKLLVLPPNIVFDAWLDANYLKIWQDGKQKQFDVVTGQINQRPADTIPDRPSASKQYPDLSLETESRNITDLKDTHAQAPAYIVWIRRTPFGKMPLGAASAGLMPQGQASDGGGFDAQSVPKAVWSPTGKQVAFTANDDLYVTDLVSASNGVPKEKLAVGLSLTCAEEKALGESNLKQIGLGIIQYSQDYDEHFPKAEGVEDAIYPYVKTREILQIGSARFVYKQPVDTALSAMEEPAATELGFMDLPCARIVLFADGHVKAFPKQETAP